MISRTDPVDLLAGEGARSERQPFLGRADGGSQYWPAAILVGDALTGFADDPGSPTDGWLWHNSTIKLLRARLGGVTRILADQDVPWISPDAGDYALNTSGADGAVTGVLAEAAGRVDLFAFIP